MEKEEILNLIDQRIEIAIKKLKKELDIEGDKKIEVKSLQQFIDEKEPRKVASEEMPVIAYYLREIDKRKLPDVDEKIMKMAYKEINRFPVKRITQAFKDSRYFEKVPGKKGFYKLNDDGDYFIEVILERRKQRQRKKKYGK